MGAYENPQTAIDTQSANIWAQTIANIGKQTANAVNTINERKSKQIKEAEENRLKDDEARQKEKDKITTSIQDFGGRSESIFAMAFADIDQKFNYKSALRTAKTKEEREAASKGIALYDRRIRASIGIVQDLEDFRERYAESSKLQHGQPGGSFLGKMSSDDKWSSGIGKNTFLKNALIGRAVGKDNKVIKASALTYYQTDDGVMMAKLEGYEDFNVIDVISKPVVEIEDIENGPDGMSKMLDEFKGKDGKILPQYFGETVIKRNKDKNNLETVKTIKQYAPGFLTALGDKINIKAYGMADSVSSESAYNDLNATYNSYGGDGNLDKKIDFTLTDKGKADFAKMMLTTGGQGLIGNGEVVESEVKGRYALKEGSTQATQITEEAGFTKDPEKITVSDSEKLGEIVKEVKAKPIAEQVRYIRDQFNQSDQDIAYDEKTGIITETIKKYNIDTTTGQQVEAEPEIRLYSIDSNYGGNHVKEGNKIETLGSWNNRLSEIILGPSKSVGTTLQKQRQALEDSKPPPKK